MKTSRSLNQKSIWVMIARPSTRHAWTNNRACLRASRQKDNHWPRISLASQWVSSSRRSRRLSSNLLPRSPACLTIKLDKCWPIKQICDTPLQPSFTAMKRNSTPLKNKKNTLLQSMASRDKPTSAKGISGLFKTQLRQGRPVSAGSSLPRLRASPNNIYKAKILFKAHLEPWLHQLCKGGWRKISWMNLRTAKQGLHHRAIGLPQVSEKFPHPPLFPPAGLEELTT